MQLPATSEQAQCLATPQNARAPGLSPVARVSVNISSPSRHRQHASPHPPHPPACLHCKLWFKTANKKKRPRAYLGQVQAHLPDNPSLHPAAVYTYLTCSRCGTKGSPGPAPAAAQAAGQRPAPQPALGSGPRGARPAPLNPRPPGSAPRRRGGRTESTCHAVLGSPGAADRLGKRPAAAGVAGSCHQIWDGARALDPPPHTLAGAAPHALH